MRSLATTLCKLSAAELPLPLPGKTLNNAVRCATIQVVEGMIQLTEVILRTPQER